MRQHDSDASSMKFLSRLRLRTKLALLLGLFALALVVSIGAAASLLRHRMVDDRVDKLRAVVQSTIAIAQSLEDRVLAHALTREQALALLRDDMTAAQRYVAEMRQQSEQVLRCLDEFGRAYPSTTSADRFGSAMAA
jgi:hypothetical protein